MNSQLAKILVTFFCVFLFVSAAQCKHHHKKHSHNDAPSRKFIVTLPKQTADYTKEYKLSMHHKQEFKFSFKNQDTLASAYFDHKPSEVFEIKNDQKVKNSYHGKHTLVFKLHTKNQDTLGKTEVLTVFGAKKHHGLTKEDIMNHKAFILVPLYIGIGFTAILSATVMIVAVVFVARTLMGGPSKKRRTHLPVYASFPETEARPEPAVHVHQPMYPSMGQVYSPARYYVHTERSPLIGSMYPSVSSAGNIQQVNDNQKQ